MRQRVELMFLVCVLAMATALQRYRVPIPAVPFPGSVSGACDSFVAGVSVYGEELSRPRLRGVEVDGCHLGMGKGEVSVRWPESKVWKGETVTCISQKDEQFGPRAYVRNAKVVAVFGTEARVGSTVIRVGDSKERVLELLGGPEFKSYGSCGHSGMVDWVYCSRGVTLSISFPNLNEYPDWVSSRPELLEELSQVREVRLTYGFRVRML